MAFTFWAHPVQLSSRYVCQKYLQKLESATDSRNASIETI